MSTEDPGQIAHNVARNHLIEMYEQLDHEDEGEDVDWAEAGAMAPFDGCEDCVVREVLNAGLTSLLGQGAIKLADDEAGQR